MKAKKQKANPVRGSEKILRILAQYKSMAFLELAAISDIHYSDLKNDIRELEKKGIVKVSNPGNILEESVTLRELGFRHALR